ncbi:MAG: acyl-CoA dehydrogenase C-terminal domain-containing protein [Gemmatimonadaceae bacterium]|nr:acyl-CoA dehydrogenase C-terminal domain-containing protein [Gemmatimonadaceae bacterium]
MPTYKAPLDDMKFVLNDVIDYSRLVTLPGYADFDAGTAMSVLEGAAQFCEEVLQPLNQSGDSEGCHIEDGTVTTPKGFIDAYRQYVAAGWPALSADEAFGGQGFPQTLRFAVEEMMCASNLSFGMFPGLSHGAYHALLMHGTDALKTTWLPKLVTGEWAGTMCLTEAHCGTDLGLLTTKAVPREDGSYAITGNKIFISAGDHDLTSNIVHLVLARLPDAPPGIKGISLFIVPKFLLVADGTPGDANGVRCVSIEHKMGIKASPTCVLAFDDSIGWLVGETNKGMRGMFTMMNAARLAVGMQGLGISEVAYQNAVSYAKDRLQGRSLTGPKNPAGPADPLIVHPDVRRMLMTIRAFNEGARALSLWVGTHIDLHEKHPDPAVRKDADDFVALMTPIVKAYFTDMGSECANMAMQIYGGHGYIREYGMEQFVRDARIAQIYEGANGIQALDLVGRKLPAEGGRFLRFFFHPLSERLQRTVADPQLREFAEPLSKIFARLQQATQFVAMKALGNPDEAGAASSDYLRLFGLVALGDMWLRMAEAAYTRLPAADGDRLFLETKIHTARFYFTKVLPEAHGLFARIMAGAAPVMALEADAF